jgi:putative addiction module component (TIGR02574 family)
MLATKAEVIAAGKALPEDERMEVIAELQATVLPEPPDGITHEEFEAELERRWQAHLADPSRSRPAHEVIAEIRQKYGNHG